MKILKRKPSKICPACEKRFFRKKGISLNAWNRRIYCSRHCFDTKMKLSKICPVCKKKFFKTISISNWNRQIYCSLSCCNAGRVKVNTHQHIKDNSLLISSGCVEWQRCCTGKGYGLMTHLMKRYYVHRLVWTLEKGEIPEGLYVCHHCDNPKCCNIEHLFLGTPQDNVDDMVQKGRQSKGRYKKLNYEPILKLIRDGFYSYTEIGNQFKRSTSVISRIATENGIYRYSKRRSSI